MGGDDMEKQINYNGFKFTRDDKTGYYLSTVKIHKRKRIRLHRYIWICHYGEIPDGYDIHHIDGDRNNNDIENLTIMIGKKHKGYHFRKAALDPNKLAKWPEIRQMGSNAHKRPEMRKKQADRSKDQWEKRKQAEPRVVKCKVCGKDYETYHLGHTENCSRSCKQKSFYRRFKREHGYGYDKKIRPKRKSCKKS